MSTNPEVNAPIIEEPKTKKLSGNPNKAMSQMIVIIENLREQMEAETAALRETDTKSFMVVQEDKIGIARQYLDGMKDLLSRTEALKNADPALRSQLEEVRSSFGVAVQENLKALKLMNKGVKRLEERIIDAARREADKENKFAYGATGHLQNGVASRIGINERA